MDTRQPDTQNTANRPQPKTTDKAHAVALALHRAGFAVSHALVNGVQMRRVITAYTARKAGAA